MYLNLSVVLTGTSSLWIDTHLVCRENPISKCVLTNDLALSVKGPAVFRNSHPHIFPFCSPSVAKTQVLQHDSYLCLVLIWFSVVRDIGKQHEFTWKKWVFTFFSFNSISPLCFALHNYYGIVWLHWPFFIPLCRPSILKMKGSM